MTEKDLAEDAPWKKIQQNTFTRWCNEHLKCVNKRIGNLQTDLSDGLRLIALLEVLSQKHMYRKYHQRPTFRQMQLENVSVALEFLDRESIKLVSIGECSGRAGAGRYPVRPPRAPLRKAGSPQCAPRAPLRPSRWVWAPGRGAAVYGEEDVGSQAPARCHRGAGTWRDRSSRCAPPRARLCAWRLAVGGGLGLGPQVKMWGFVELGAPVSEPEDWKPAPAVPGTGS